MNDEYRRGYLFILERSEESYDIDRSRKLIVFDVHGAH